MSELVTKSGAREQQERKRQTRTALERTVGAAGVTTAVAALAILGALPLIEGFGRDYELPPETAYNETCAALGSMFWSGQMLFPIRCDFTIGRPTASGPGTPAAFF